MRNFNLTSDEARDFFRLVKDYVFEKEDGVKIDYCRIDENGVYGVEQHYRDEDLYEVDLEYLTPEYVYGLRDARIEKETAKRLQEEKEREEKRIAAEKARKERMEREHREWEAREAIERPIREAKAKEKRRLEYLKLKEEFES